MYDPDTSRFHAVVGRALSDSDFQQRLMSKDTRNAALEEMGVTGNQLSAIDTEIENAIAALNELKRAFGEIQAAR